MRNEQSRGSKGQGPTEDKGKGSRSADTEGQVPNPVQIQKFLGGLDYPVGKEDILERARSEGADEAVMEALERIPDREYDSPVSISREVGKLD